MSTLTDPSLPLVVLGNFAEGHYEFLNRAKDIQARQELLEDEDAHGDRVLLWLREPKMTISSYPIRHAERLLNQLNFHQTLHLMPPSPSGKLCSDILHEPGLINRIIDYAGPGRAIQLVPYASTAEFYQLVASLQTDHHLQVILPESPSPDLLWLRDYIDSKAGFRCLIQECKLNSSTSLLPAFICQNRTQAAQTADWFIHQGKTCIIKADTSENGIGHVMASPENYPGFELFLEKLQRNSFINGDLITVEQYLGKPCPLSPSLEMFVPPKGLGQPQITYLSQQLFKDGENIGDFYGVLICPEFVNSSWYNALADSGLNIARHLQSLGYVGHFDLDCVVDDDGHIYLLEINARRTGGTHVHELAKQIFGNNYIDRICLLSNDSANSGKIDTVDRLFEALDPLLFPVGNHLAGVFVTITSMIRKHKFGYIMVGRTTQELITLEEQLAELLGE